MPARHKGEKVETGIWELAGGDGYLVDISVIDPESGKRIRFRKPIHRLDLAKKWRDRRKGDALRGEIHGRGPKKVTFSAFADEYFGLWREDRKESTAHAEKIRIDGILKPYFGKRPIHTITRKDVETFLQKRREGSLSEVVAQRRRNRRAGPVTSATANRDLCRLKNMFRYAVNWGYLKENPVLGIRQSEEKIEVADFLEEDEVIRFLGNCEDAYRPVFEVAIYTGMRYGEIMGLEWRDVNWNWNRIRVRDPKNSEDRHVPMNKATREAVLGLIPEGTVLRDLEESQKRLFANPATGKVYRDVRKAMRRSLDKAGIKRHIRFHDLRHTTGSHLAMRGATEREIAEVLGHKDPKMARRYSHLTPSHVQSVVDRLDFSNKGSRKKMDTVGAEVSI